MYPPSRHSYTPRKQDGEDYGELALWLFAFLVLSILAIFMLIAGVEHANRQRVEVTPPNPKIGAVMVQPVPAMSRAYLEAEVICIPDQIGKADLTPPYGSRLVESAYDLSQ